MNKKIKAHRIKQDNFTKRHCNVHVNCKANSNKQKEVKTENRDEEVSNDLIAEFKGKKVRKIEQFYKKKL